MSSKTLAIMAGAGRISGAVIESSIGSLKVTDVFDVAVAAGAAWRLPVHGPFDRVVATLESQAAVFRILSLPFRDRRRISQAVGPALEEHVPFSLDDGVLSWDFTSAGRGHGATGATGAAATGAVGAATTGVAGAAASGGASVLAALAETSRIDETRARLAALGIEPAPQRLLWSPAVILTAYRRAMGADASFTAVDIGDGGALVACIDAGNVTALRILAPCEDELLVRNLAWTLATIAGDQPRTVVGGRHGVRLCGALAERSPGLRVEMLPVAPPVDGLAGHDWRELTALAGLLISIAGDGLAPILDFEAGAGSLFGVAAIREVQGEVRPLLWWAAAAAALAVFAVGLDYVQLFAERRELVARAEQVYASAMPAGSGGAGRKIKMDMRLRELTGKAEAAAGNGAGSPLALLAALSREVPKQLDVTVDHVEHAPPSARVAGHAGSFEAVTRMQEALQKSGAFSRVEVKDVHAAVTAGTVEFVLELTSAAEAGA